MRTLLVGQSGGPTAVINGSLYGVLQEATESGAFDRVLGCRYGIEGFLSGMTFPLSSLTESERARLRITPGSFLGSCRKRLPSDLTDRIYDKLFHRFEEEGIEVFLYIGGNDSMDTLDKISRAAAERGSSLRCIGIPKTVDNDLMHTDHTPGYGSAARYIASTMRSIASDTDAYRVKSVTIVSIMGRDTGWLTASAALARRYEGDNPSLIYLPEIPFSEERFLRNVSDELQNRDSCLIAVSEGIQNQEGIRIGEKEGVYHDAFGHKMLSGAASHLEGLVHDYLKIKVRSFELSLPQRCFSPTLSLQDLTEAEEAGRFGVRSALRGESGQMVTFFRKENSPYSYECRLFPVHQISNKVKYFPREWVCEDLAGVTEDFFSYASPLIQGDVLLPLKGGLPDYLSLKDEKAY